MIRTDVFIFAAREDINMWQSTSIYLYLSFNIIYYILYSILVFDLYYIYNRYRDHCECSDEKPRADEQKKQEECRKCAGDESKYCGGLERISIYENDWFGLLHFFFIT